MRRLTYVLQFKRAPKSAGNESPQAIAQSVRFTTIIGTDEVTGEIEVVYGGSAVMVNEATVDPGGQTFTEKGTITFGEGGGFGSFSFSSVGKGYLLDCAEKPFNVGMVMWQIESGEGFFAGATGTITSNFLIDLNTEELIDHHFGLIYLP